MLAGVLGVLMLAGCGAGQDAATSLTRPSIPGVDADGGDIHVRNVVVTYSPEGYPPGGDAPVTLAIGNTGRDPVRLVEIDSEGASSVSITGVTRVGTASPAPGGEPGGQVEVVPGELVSVTLEVTGLRDGLDGTKVLPLEFTFDTGLTLSVAVPMDTPEDPLPRPSADVEQSEH